MDLFAAAAVEEAMHPPPFLRCLVGVLCLSSLLWIYEGSLDGVVGGQRAKAFCHRRRQGRRSALRTLAQPFSFEAVSHPAPQLGQAAAAAFLAAFLPSRPAACEGFERECPICGRSSVGCGTKRSDAGQHLKASRAALAPARCASPTSLIVVSCVAGKGCEILFNAAHSSLVSW